MAWTFHEHERFPGYGWIEPIMHPNWHLIDMKVGKHIVDEHNREIENDALRRAASALWEGITDMLDQSQIDRIEHLYREELAVLLRDEP